jgi:hypothetical protein
MFEDVFADTEDIDFIDRYLKNFIPFKSIDEKSPDRKGGTP